MPLNIPAIATMEVKELDQAIASLEPHELEPARAALNAHITSLGINNEKLELQYLSAFSRVVARCRLKSSGPPKPEKAAKTLKGKLDLNAALDF